MDNKQVTGLLALDLSKAFDSIDHQILLTKLKHLGCDNNVLKFFQNYLEDRTQLVKLEDILSEPKPISCGVPQGSVLGPLLFNIYINDLPHIINHSKISMFADDSTLYHSNDNAQELEDKLNADFMIVHQWLIAHKLCLNIEKTQFIIIGLPKQFKKFENVKISYNNKLIKQSTTIKLLGVTLDSKLNWNKHISNLIIRCKTSLRAFMRSTRYMDIDTKKMLYNAVIAARLNYADVIWGNCGTSYSNKLQTIQNIAARNILNRDPRSSIQPSLSTLKWLSLAKKRKVHYAVQLYKIIHGLAPATLSQWLFRTHHRFETRNSNGNNQSTARTLTSQSFKSFFHTATKIWNDIPDDVRDAPSWLSFKNRLTKFYLNSLN